jgi:hypothetical protein
MGFGGPEIEGGLGAGLGLGEGMGDMAMAPDIRNFGFWTSPPSNDLPSALFGFGSPDYLAVPPDIAGSDRALQQGTEPKPVADSGFAPSPPRDPQSPAQPPGEGRPAPDYAGTIGAMESGNRYDLLGPLTRSGDRAYGRYQVMGANVGPWTQELLGRRMTPQEFLRNPAAQDAVFQGKFVDQYIPRYGEEGAARAWLGGPGAVNSPTRADQLGTSVGRYGQNFMRRLGQPPPAQGATAPPSVAAQDAPVPNWMDRVQYGISNGFQAPDAAAAPAAPQSSAGIFAGMRPDSDYRPDGSGGFNIARVEIDPNLQPAPISPTFRQGVDELRRARGLPRMPGIYNTPAIADTSGGGVLGRVFPGNPISRALGEMNRSFAQPNPLLLAGLALASGKTGHEGIANMLRVLMRMQARGRRL